LLLVSVVVMGLAMSAAAELWSTQIQRDKEEELLFRLGQYRAAIARYRAERNRLPQKVDDLLQDRTQLATRRYLRRAYTDPMTGKEFGVKLLADRTGAVAGIQDVFSKSERTPLKNLGPNKKTYKDW